MFYQLFFSPEVKRCAIITYKHDIRVASQVANLRKLGNIKKLTKIPTMIAYSQFLCQNENFVNTLKYL